MFCASANLFFSSLLGQRMFGSALFGLKIVDEAVERFFVQGWILPASKIADELRDSIALAIVLPREDMVVETDWEEDFGVRISAPQLVLLLQRRSISRRTAWPFKDYSLQMTASLS